MALSFSSPLAANFCPSYCKINDNNRYQEDIYEPACELKDLFESHLHLNVIINANFTECFRSSYYVSGPLRCTTCLSYGKKIITIGAVSSKDDFCFFRIFALFALYLYDFTSDRREQTVWVKRLFKLPIII